MTDLSLSEYAGWLYGQPGIEPLLLDLQDAAGLDVLLLLTACWLGQRQVQMPASGWEELATVQRPWREGVIEPLRQVRRRLAADPAARTLYQQVKAVELAAEWQQLERLERISKNGERGHSDGGRTDLLEEHLKACCLAQQIGANADLLHLAQLARAAAQGQ